MTIKYTFKLFLAVVFSFVLSVNANADTQQAPSVTFTTDMGDITLSLFPDKAPATVANFLNYAESGFYNGTIFHRIVPGFVVQGGGHTFDFTPKPTNAPVKNESIGGLKNKEGTLSMARRPHPDSATSQFFINLKNNHSLDAKKRNDKDEAGYTVFAEITEGMNIVHNMARVPRGQYRRYPEAPNVSIRILSTQIHSQ